MFLLYSLDREVLFTVIERSTDFPWRHHSGRNAPVVCRRQSRRDHWRPAEIRNQSRGERGRRDRLQLGI